MVKHNINLNIQNIRYVCMLRNLPCRNLTNIFFSYTPLTRFENYGIFYHSKLALATIQNPGINVVYMVFCYLHPNICCQLDNFQMYSRFHNNNYFQINHFHSLLFAYWIYYQEAWPRFSIACHVDSHCGASQCSIYRCTRFVRDRTDAGPLHSLLMQPLGPDNDLMILLFHQQCCLTLGSDVVRYGIGLVISASVLDYCFDNFADSYFDLRTGSFLAQSLDLLVHKFGDLCRHDPFFALVDNYDHFHYPITRTSHVLHCGYSMGQICSRFDLALCRYAAHLSSLISRLCRSCLNYLGCRFHYISACCYCYHGMIFVLHVLDHFYQ